MQDTLEAVVKRMAFLERDGEPPAERRPAEARSAEARSRQAEIEAAPQPAPPTRGSR